MTEFEHRYRRLLRLYPMEHREAHEDEMLGVLLASARPGQQGPTIREALDLILGAFAIHLRRILRTIRRDWADAFAIASLLLSLLVAMAFGMLAGRFLLLNIIEHGAQWNSAYLLLASIGAAWPCVIILAITGRRRASVVVAWTTALALGVPLAIQGAMVDFAALGVLAAFFATGSRRSARGFTLIGGSRAISFVAGVVGLALAYGYREAGDAGLRPAWAGPRLALIPLLIGIILIARAAFRFGGSADRRASVLLALPVTAILVGAAQTMPLIPESINETTIGTHSLGYWIELGLRVVLPLVAFVLVLLRVRRARRQSGHASR
ncbi:MAG: hypothetical protein ABR548_10465 [Actinomycetota bacterium]|nr:hypothetical protein [Actinomycetota bacterium]